MPEPVIRILSDHVANKIAAGEVVDRPASVFKELVENALDAGATQIQAEVVVGGRKALIVSDNGRGMTRDQALLSVERHATSKIRDVDDIEAVGTLGFRGEALAAIAAVSRFVLTTRRADEDIGTEIVLSGGQIQEVNDAGSPPGTTMRVRNLFFNVPARRKFLRTEQTELSHIKQMFHVYALAHPGIAFRLLADERELYQLPPASSLRDRLHDLYSREFVDGLVPIDFSMDGVQLGGFVGPPNLHRGDRGEQYIFTNGRPASAPLVAHAINQAFKGLLPKNRHPVLFLFISLDPGLVDVNVHPMKKEVRFRNSNAVRDAVIGAIDSALREQAGVPAGTPAMFPAAEASGAVPLPAPLRSAPAPQEIPALKYHELKAELQVPMPEPHAPPPAADGLSVPATPVPAAPGTPWKWCRVIDRVGSRFAVLETEDGLVILDPKTAHERVVFERFMDEVESQRINAQGLLAPETVTLVPRDAEQVRGHLEVLRSMGFGVDDFGGDAFIVDALPVCLGPVSPERVLADVAACLEQGSRGGSRAVEERIARTACRTAVNASDRLSQHELEALVEDLGRTRMPYTCPHGRPTMIFMGFGELDRKFGRR